jgi:transcriptional regulator with GAF, ATPase, and Fis domain
MDRYRRKVLLAALKKCDGKRTAAAQLLGVDLVIVSWLCRKYGVAYTDCRGRPRISPERATVLIEALERNGWSQARTARQLGVSKQRVGQLVKAYRVEIPAH